MTETPSEMPRPVGPTTNLLLTTSTLRNADLANVEPTVAITSPPDGATFPFPASLDITADAADADGVVSQVDFLANGQPIGGAFDRPYHVTWAPPAAGSYLMYVRATDNAGAYAYSTAVRVRVGSLRRPPAPSGADVSAYYDVDAVGSVRAITDDSGATTARYDYLPFGERWNTPAASQPRQFAGKEQDPETGFDYFGGRFLLPVTGRFTTVDPKMNVDASLFDPQRWNRYSYALNSPLRFTDPDGRSATLLSGLIGGINGGGAALLEGESWREIGAAAAGGAVSGAMIGSVLDTGGASLPVLLTTGALAGIEGRLVEDTIRGNTPAPRDATLAGFAGAAGVAAGEGIAAAIRPSASTAIGEIDPVGRSGARFFRKAPNGSHPNGRLVHEKDKL